MELRHLRYFVAVAEELHFGRAARRMHIAQPPLSQQIKQLEHELGAPLFTRTSHKVELAAAGHLLLPRARDILERTQSAVEAIKRMAEGEIGTITIGYVEEAVHFAFPQLINPFQAAYPGVECLLKDMHSTDQAEALQNGSIDIGFGYDRGGAANIESRSVLTGRIMLAVPSSHPLAAKKTANLARLRDESFIFPVRRQAPHLHDFFMSICNANGLVPNIKYTAEHIYIVMGLVRSGVGVTLFPDFLRQEEWQGVKILPISGAAHSLDMWASWRKDREESILIKRFLELLSETFSAGTGIAPA